MNTEFGSDQLYEVFYPSVISVQIWFTPNDTSALVGVKDRPQKTRIGLALSGGGLVYKSIAALGLSVMAVSLFNGKNVFE